MGQMDLDRAVDQALAILASDLRERFAANPRGVLADDLHLQVQAVDHLAQRRDDGGACDGVSFLRDGVILYAPTPRSRRENFTLAHELGHWLVDQSGELYDWLADQADPPRVLETLCDRIAQRLLVRESDVADVIREGPVRAHHLTDLYEVTQASRPACAIALAKRLPYLGAVAIVDPGTRKIAHASVRPDPQRGWPTVFPWPGQAVPAGHPLARLRPGTSVARRSFWRDRYGREQEYYIDAFNDGRRSIVVFCEVDLWGAERLHLDHERAFDERPITEIQCCGGSREVRGWPCPACGQPHCPRCGSCRCQRRDQREQLCQGGCFLRFQPHLLVGGLCEECRG